MAIIKSQGRIIVSVKVTPKIVGDRFYKIRTFIAKWICIIVGKLLSVKFKMDIKQVK